MLETKLQNGDAHTNLLPAGERLHVTGNALVSIDGIGKYSVSSSAGYGPYSDSVVVRITAFGAVVVRITTSADEVLGVPTAIQDFNGKVVGLRDPSSGWDMPRGYEKKVFSIKGRPLFEFASAAFLPPGASFSGNLTYGGQGRLAVQSSGTITHNPTGWHDGTACIEFTPNSDAGEFRYYFGGALGAGLENSPLNFNDPNGIGVEFEITDIDTSKSSFSINMEFSTDATSLYPANKASIGLWGNDGSAATQKEAAGRKYYRVRFDSTNSTTKSAPFPDRPYNPALTGTGADYTKPVTFLRVIVNKFAGKTVKFKRITLGGWSTPCIIVGTDSAGPESLDRLVAPLVIKNKLEFYGNQYWSILDSNPEFRDRYDRLYAAGWELCGNDLQDRPLGVNVTDRPTMRGAIQGTLEKHKAAGWYEGTRTWIANNNSTSYLMIEELQRAGYVCNRNGITEGRYVLPEGGVPDAFRMPAESLDGKFLTDVQPWIDRCIEYGATLWLYFHNVWSKAQIDTDRTNNITGTSGAPIAVNTNETPAAYRARAAGLGTAIGNATVTYLDARIGTTATLAIFYEDLKTILDYIGAKQAAGQLVTRTPSNWCRDVGLL